MDVVDKEARLQAEEYSFPYHYLPRLEPGYALSRGWNFAASYLAALELIYHALAQWQDGRSSVAGEWKHLDIGCGDGALIYHLRKNKALESVDWCGVDYDPRAIGWARMFNPGVSFQAGDVADVEPEGFDSASLVEVAEHIPPEELDGFISKCAAALRPRAYMVVTVPSIQKPVQAKHYQHFTFEGIENTLAGEFEVLSIKGFERHTLWSRLLHRAVYRTPVSIDGEWVARHLIHALRRTYEDIRGCGRILVTLRKRA